ncbi:hypothetical protein LCGC14_0723910 [marine sediment metagenome]|uniref:Uncharacterized protein n=1 Tax=marine sediment metagenome TaxID=412755 RepID=A0A0F9QBK5_9ZZZZ
MSDEQNKQPDCPQCGETTKRSTFRTGSMSVPKREEDHCGSCGTHAPAQVAPANTTEE